MKSLFCSRPRHTAQEKATYILHILTGKISQTTIHQTTGIDQSTLIAWKKQFLANAHLAFTKTDHKTSKPRDVQIERQQKQIDLLKKLLEHYKRIQTSPCSKLVNTS